MSIETQAHQLPIHRPTQCGVFRSRNDETGVWSLHFRVLTMDEGDDCSDAKLLFEAIIETGAFEPQIEGVDFT